MKDKHLLSGRDSQYLEWLEGAISTNCRPMQWYLSNVDIELDFEKDHLCIPGAEVKEGGCVGEDLTDRTTVDEYMDSEAYTRWARAVGFRAAAADGAGSGGREL